MSPAETPGTIRDRRIVPRGVLPRHVQMWLMVALAVVILGIILVTGRQEPAPRVPSGSRPTEPSLVSPDRVRRYEQALAAEAARQDALAQPPAAAPSRMDVPRARSAAAVDPRSEEQRRLESQSLFADSVALSRRPSARQSYAEPRRVEPPTSPAVPTPGDLEWLQPLLARARPEPTVRPPAVPPRAPESQAPRSEPAPPRDPPPANEAFVPAPPVDTEPNRSGRPLTRLIEGTLIEAVLLNRLDGTFAGPVTCLVTTPVYAHDRQSVVIPAGARVLGDSAPVQTWGESRLAVRFHRLVMPDGHTYSLDRFTGLNQIGDTGLKDRVNRHYAQVFGASLAIGALSGLAQYGSRGGLDSYSVGDAYRQAAGSSLAASAGRVLDRYLNVLPTITIREGYRIKVYLTNDLDLPIHAPVTPGGVR